MEDVDNLTYCNPIPIQFPTPCKVKHIPIKRGFDIVFSLFCLIIGFPFFILIALTIFITSPGNVFYSHQRIGRGGKSIKCYKFRSMFPDANHRLQKIINDHPHLRDEWSRNFKLKNDPRVTSFGAFLRKTSLDEIPQFWNVLKGDLSIVGPRPVVIEELKKYYHVKAYKVLSVRPGLTGIWQVSGRSDVKSYDTRVEMDEYYVDNHSFLLDLKLIAKTIPAMILSKGAY